MISRSIELPALRECLLRLEKKIETPAGIARLVLGRSLGMVAAGLLLGAPAVWAGRRVAVAALDGLPPVTLTPLIFGAAAMLAIALLASWIPARRSAHVDLLEALRYE